MENDGSDVEVCISCAVLTPPIRTTFFSPTTFSGFVIDFLNSYDFIFVLEFSMSLGSIGMKQALPISLVLRTSIVKPSKVVVTKPVAETRVGLHSLQVMTIASHATVWVELGVTKALARKPR